MFILEVIVSLILLILSSASFFPQLQHLRNKRNATGISPWYLLVNLGLVTQSFTLMLAIVAIHPEFTIGNSPRDIRDWLNLSQCTAAWIGHLMLLILTFILPPKRPAQKILTGIIFLVFVTLTTGPVLLNASTSLADGGWDAVAAGIIVMSLIYIVNPIVQLAGVFGAGIQILVTLRTTKADETFKAKHLLAQAAILSTVGVSFTWRLRLLEEYKEAPLWMYVHDWY